MKRRDALKTLVIASGGAVAIPSWAIGWKVDKISKFNTSFTEYEINIISSVVDTIIPSNGEIGALSVGVDQYLVGLISQCYEKEFRGQIRANLYELDDTAKETEGKSFSECERKVQEKLLLAMSSGDDENDEDFFNFMKRETIRGFETSEEVMVNYHGWVLMPGFYDGNVDVETK